MIILLMLSVFAKGIYFQRWYDNMKGTKNFLVGFAFMMFISASNLSIAKAEIMDGLYRYYSETNYYCFNLKSKKYVTCKKDKWIREKKGFILCEFNYSVRICTLKKEENV